MKLLKKGIALLLIAVMLCSLAACGKSGKWILKSGETELPVGTYLSYLYSFYLYACYMSEDTSTSPLGQKLNVTDNGESLKRDASEWIKETALNNCKAIVNIMEQCRKAGITLTAEEVSSAEKAAQNDWSTYYARYQGLGISMNSVRVLYQYTTYTQKLMDYLYGAEGVLDPIADDAVRSYYLKNYTYTEYFTISLAGETEGSVSYNKLVSYADNLSVQINSGALTVEKAAEKYNADYKGSASVTADRNLLENLDYASNLKGVADNTCITFTEEDTVYVMLKHDISKDTEYLEENLDNIRSAMCRDDYNAYLDDAEAVLDIQVNEAAIEKYSPRWLEKEIEKANKNAA